MLRSLNIAFTVFGMVLLLACNRPQSAPSAAATFATIAAPREVVEANLRVAQGRVLQTSEDVLVARLAARQLSRPMNVKLTFKEGKLCAVHYWQPAPVRDWVQSTKLGQFGYRSFLDKTAMPPLRDRYLFFGPLGQVYTGSDGMVIRLTQAVFIFGAAAVLTVVGIALFARRKRHA